jgi:peptidoglycan/LPS O-acetylase OafA/YrhL
VLLLTADIHERSMYFGAFLLCSTSVAGMLSEIVEHPDGWLARGLSWRPFRAAGERTYGLYLWHWPVMLLFAHFVRDWAKFPTIATEVVLAFVVAFASYRFVERPIMQRFGPRFARITPEREARHRVAAPAPVAAVAVPAGELTAT